MSRRSLPTINAAFKYESMPEFVTVVVESGTRPRNAGSTNHCSNVQENMVLGLGLTRKGRNKEVPLPTAS
ncbi:hypothetical protein GQ457_02G028110 [Hibiscus cannabinus]